MPPSFPYLARPLHPSKLTIRGTFIDTPSRHELRIRKDTEITISPSTGKIEALVEGKQHWTHCAETETVQLTEDEVVIPGFIDCHVHAPQYKQLGTKTDVPLMEWLNKYTFPAEAAFSSVEHASKVYKALVRRLLLNGTTTALYFGSNHLEATKILAQTCAAFGQRALVGKTCSDQLLPEYYVETMEGSLRDMEAFIGYCREQWGEEGLVWPVITPRFVPTCSEELLKGLGKLATKYGCHVQSHAAESLDQVALVKQQHPSLQRDITIFQHFDLLTPKTILAHCCHLHDSEVQRMVSIGASVASCPYSNMLFAQAVLPIPRFHALGLKIGLGTDIAGGHSSAMISGVRQAILADRANHFAAPARSEDPMMTIPAGTVGGDEEEAVDFKYALHLATRGGAEALGLEEVGAFEVGMQWDAVAVGIGWEDGEEDEGQSVEERFEQWLCSHGSERDVRRVWVAGREVVCR